MNLSQFTLKKGDNISQLKDAVSQEFDFGLVFGSPKFFSTPEFKQMFTATKAPVVGCTTAGEINNGGIGDESLVFTTAKFTTGTKVKSCHTTIASAKDSFKAGAEIGKTLKAPDLKFIFILGTGTNVNGSELIKGLEEVVGPKVCITGGLAGDEGAFKETFTMGPGQVSPNMAVALGFFGGGLKIGYGSQGGWKPFGPPRKVTKADGNILYELDGQSALAVYENYLGDKAKDLPGSGLLYPFAIVDGPNKESGLIRTILGIDKQKGSLTLAGDVPVNGTLRLMHTGTDGLVDGATAAATHTSERAGQGAKAGLAILVSCVGRKLVMGTDTEDEIDAVKEMLPKQSTFTGFYSYGEICPFEKTEKPLLHNQTMTVTFLTE